ncbi:MAG: ankyrin repeat domain-containing protein [Pseudomonadota bacterium]
MPSKLDKLRSEAKALKKAAAAGDAAAIARLRRVVPGEAAPKHADFLHVVAVESGFDSWPKLKFALETAAMSRAERADRLRRALYFGQAWAVKKLLGAEPDLAQEGLDLQIATHDAAAVRRAVSRAPAQAAEKIGLRSPILHLAFSHYVHIAPETAPEMLEIARLLVANGADVNDGCPPEPGSEHRLSALYGALGHADNMALAAWLLDHGASPDDDESLYHATELGHTDGLRLLMKHGVRPSGTNALPRALDFDDVEAVRLLLEHGADPNEAVAGHPSGQPIDTIPALHQAARRWRSAEIGALLLAFGADAGAVWRGHTAYALARIYGAAPIADLLEARGLATPLSATERALAACAEGAAPAARLADAELSEEDRLLLTRLVSTPTPLAHLQALVAAGLDPNRPEEMGLTPLHVAAWEGLPERLAYFLTLDPDLDHVNGYGGDALGTVIHGAEFCPKAAERDHIDCARLLLEAGATLRPSDVARCGDDRMALFLESWSGGSAPRSD